MTDLLTDLATFISAGGVDPSIIFRDTMPDAPDIMVGLFEYSGSASLPQIAGVNRPVQINCRHTSATSAKEAARDIHRMLQTDNGILYLTPERWCMLSISQPPFKIKVDDKNRIYYGFNILVTTYYD